MLIAMSVNAMTPMEFMEIQVGDVLHHNTKDVDVIVCWVEHSKIQIASLDKSMPFYEAVYYPLVSRNYIRKDTILSLQQEIESLKLEVASIKWQVSAIAKQLISISGGGGD